MSSETEHITYAAALDANGIWRGKRLPPDLEAEAKSGFRMPLSTLFLDIWGHDIDGGTLFVASGDRDATCVPTGRDPVITSSGERGHAALRPHWFVDNDGTPHPADPRAALALAEARLTARGLKATIGTELEFYLLTEAGQGFDRAGTLSIQDLQRTEAFQSDVHRELLAAEIRITSLTSEGGPGQFEVVLAPWTGALDAADDFVLTKYIVRSVARRHGYRACFMAKPLATYAGNGFHTHVSLSDKDGTNIFSDGAPEANPALRAAIGGLLKALPQSMLVFAPHANSYRRFGINSLAPMTLSWGVENRTAAIRIPGGSAKARRIEARIAGADANPYLVLTALLAGVDYGLEHNPDPGPPIQEGAYETEGEQLPIDWYSALAAFEAAEGIGPIFPDILATSFAETKRQEIGVFNSQISKFEQQAYEDIV